MMDLGWLAYAWSIFNSACAFTTALCALWLVRHAARREADGVWRRTSAWKNRKMRERSSAERERLAGASESDRHADRVDGVPLAGERAADQSEDVDERTTSS